MAASAQRVPLTAYMTGRGSEQHGREDGLRSERHPTLFPGDTEGAHAGRDRFPDVSVERFAGQGSPNGGDDATLAPLSTKHWRSESRHTFNMSILTLLRLSKLNTGEESPNTLLTSKSLPF